MKREKSSFDELLKAYKAASSNEKKNRTFYLSDRTAKGIYFLQKVYTEVYFKQTGLKRAVPIDNIVGLAIESMINDTLARVKEEAKKFEST